MQRAPQAEPGPMIRVPSTVLGVTEIGVYEYREVRLRGTEGRMGEKIGVSDHAARACTAAPGTCVGALRARVFPTKRPSDVHAPVPGSQT